MIFFECPISKNHQYEKSIIFQSSFLVSHSWFSHQVSKPKPGSLMLANKRYGVLQLLLSSAILEVELLVLDWSSPGGPPGEVSWKLSDVIRNRIVSPLKHEIYVGKWNVIKLQWNFSIHTCVHEKVMFFIFTRIFPYPCLVSLIKPWRMLKSSDRN